MLERLDRSALREVVLGHNEQLGLCKALERIADALPHDLDAKRCREAAVAIHRVMTRVAMAEQDIIGRELAEGGSVLTVNLAPTIERLRRENAEDLSYAEELQETLRDYGTDQPSVSIDALGYMLRGFFESRRRRIALEREILDALAPPPQ
tara:strand:+ start:10063 stop:10515 length:453 start_codon:yes stop_codon:yes gene_type:complete